jgi:two-component system cell cycle sensor histidine kinase/response regulator CckA
MFNAKLNLWLLYSIMLLMKEIFSKIGQRLFTPPIWGDQDKTLAARQVFSIVRAFLLSATFLQLIQLVIAPVFSVHWLLLLLATFAVSLLLLEIARRGHVTWAAFMLVVSLWLLITIFSWRTASGFGPRAAWGYFIVVFIAGMLLGRRLGILTAGLCSAATLFIGVTSPIRSPDPVRFWLINTLYLAIVLMLQNLASRSIRESLHVAKQQLLEKRQVEAALVKSERKHREMVNSLPFCVFEMDLSGLITFVNKTGLEWFGYNEAEFLAGMNVFQILVDADENRAKENLNRLMSGQDLSYSEYQARCKDGSIITVLIRSRLLLEGGRPVAVQGSLIDIRERKQAEKEKEQIISLQKATIESTADGILVIDHAGKITDFNQRFTQLWHIPDSVLAVRDDAQALHFIQEQLLDPQGFMAKVRELYAASDQESFDLLRFKDGRCFERYSRPQLISGQTVGRVWSFRDISERKRAEEALLVSNQFISTLLRAIPVAVFFTDKVGKYTGCNDAFTEIMGVTSDEIKGKTVQEIWPGELAEIYHQKDLVLIKERKHQVYEFQIKDKHGRFRPVIFAKDVFLNANGAVGGMVGAFLDITDRKQAEKALQESEEKYRQTMNVSPIGIFIIQDLLFTFVNPEMARLHGYAPEEMIDLLSPTDALVVPEHRDMVRQTLLSRQAGVRGRPYEIKAVRKDGSIFDALVWGQGIIYGGKPASVGTLMDISESKRAEEALKESEHRYRTLIESANDAIFVMKEGLFFDCNSKTLEMFGCRREQIIGVSPDHFSPPLQPDGRNSQEKALEKIKAAYSGTPQFFEWLHCKADRTPFMTEVSLNRVQLGAGVHLLAIVRDIADRKMLEEQLRQAQKMEAVGILAGGVAHDFNNILSTIVGYASLLQMQAGPDKKLKEYLERILASTERAASLTHSLLAFSRKQAIELQPVEINDSIFGFHKVLARLIGEDIDFKLSLASESLVVDADIRQIEQVLMNLATNARDAMPHGGKLAITTRSVVLEDGSGEIPNGSYAVISVFDSGMGMDSETQGHLFEPFYTTKEVGKGTGLGLAIVYGIVKNHQGFIKVESESAQGTIFHIYLPLKPLAVQKDRCKQQPLIPTGNETILLVEDDAAVRHVTKSMLEEFGYTVLEAADGQEALAVFRRHGVQVRLLLSDLIMPKKNGRETRAGIMKLNPDIKTIFMSGYTSDIIARKGILEPGIHLLLKPLHPADLLAKIREVLDS